MISKKIIGCGKVKMLSIIGQSGAVVGTASIDIKEPQICSLQMVNTVGLWNWLRDIHAMQLVL